MNTIRTRLSALLVLAGILALLVGFPGCSSDDATLTTPVSPSAP